VAVGVGEGVVVEAVGGRRTEHIVRPDRGSSRVPAVEAGVVGEVVVVIVTLSSGAAVPAGGAGTGRVASAAWTGRADEDVGDWTEVALL
jgi:hypothetical protein